MTRATTSSLSPISRILTGLTILLTLIPMMGCPASQGKTIPNTEKDRQAFRSDPSKMPPEARQKMEEAMKAGAMNARDRGANPAPPTTNK